MKKLHALAIGWIFFWVVAPVSLNAAPKGKIVVGAKTFTEQFILGKMLTLLFEADGYEVEEKTNITTRVLREMLLKQEVDIYWEYTGTAYRAHLKRNDPAISTDAKKLFEVIQEAEKENGVVWLNKASLNNTFSLIMKRQQAEQFQLQKISDLTQRFDKKQPLKFGSGQDFYARPDGLKKMASYYGFDLPRRLVQFMGHSGIYGALERGQIEVAIGFGTDPQIEQLDLIILEDDRSFFPVYNAAPTVRAEVVESDPRIAELANRLGPLLNQATMIHLNFLVDIEKQSVEMVARNWLKEVGLLP